MHLSEEKRKEFFFSKELSICFAVVSKISLYTIFHFSPQPILMRSSVIDRFHICRFVQRLGYIERFANSIGGNKGGRMGWARCSSLIS